MRNVKACQPMPRRSREGPGRRLAKLRAISLSAVSGGLLTLIVAAGCARLTCEPLAIVVVKKEEYGRLDTTARGLRTTATGRLEEMETPTPVREYWVRSDDGSRYRVSADQYRAAEINHPAQVCR